jgi:thiamine biosynthesis lipoprotein
VDFGAIGKGYALDRMAAVLAEWDLPAALLSGGESTVLALDPPPGADGWTVGIRDPWRQSRGRLWRPDETLGSVVLRRCAFSGSGTAENGPHILDPATGRPVTGRPAAWAAAPGAAEADALSTAFMVMRLTDVVKLCRRGGGISGIIAANTPRGYAVRLAGPARGKGFKIWMFHRDLKRGKPAIPPGRR